jgi:hypothetical protein
MVPEGKILIADKLQFCPAPEALLLIKHKGGWNRTGGALKKP